MGLNSVWTMPGIIRTNFDHSLANFNYFDGTVNRGKTQVIIFSGFTTLVLK